MAGNTPVPDVVDAPTIGTATAGVESATVTFTAATTGGAATTFGAISTPGSITGTSATSPITVSGLTAATAYTFKTYGINSSGTWSNVLSAASNSVTPTASTSYESIATITVGGGGQASVEFTSIPQTYTHLQIRYIAQSAGYGRIQFNSNTTGSNYHSHYITGTGGGGGAVSGGELPGSTYSSLVWGIQNFSTTANVFNAGIIDIVDYKSTNKNKTVRILQGVDKNGSGDVELVSGQFKATPAAITTIKLFPHAANTWSQYTSFALYGIKGA